MFQGYIFDLIAVVRKGPLRCQNSSLQLFKIPTYVRYNFKVHERYFTGRLVKMYKVK